LLFIVPLAFARLRAKVIFIRIQIRIKTNAKVRIQTLAVQPLSYFYKYKNKTLALQPCSYFYKNQNSSLATFVLFL
jgi:hypothetical protein